MDTHNGALPWNFSQEKEIKYTNYKKNARSTYQTTRNSRHNRTTNAYQNSSYMRKVHTEAKQLSPEATKYRAILYRDLQNAWNFGKNQPFERQQDATTITLLVYKSGRKHIEITRSSGSQDFDKVAEDFLKSNLHLINPLPKEFDSDFFKVKIYLNKGSFGMSTAY